MSKRMLLLFCILVFFAAVCPAAPEEAGNNRSTGPDPLVRLLQAKGILSDAEAASLSQAGGAAEGGTARGAAVKPELPGFSEATILSGALVAGDVLAASGEATAFSYSSWLISPLFSRIFASR